MGIEGSKTITECASTAIPRRPAIVRGFAFVEHGSTLPGDQRVQTFGGDDGFCDNDHARRERGCEDDQQGR